MRRASQKKTRVINNTFLCYNNSVQRQPSPGFGGAKYGGYSLVVKLRVVVPASRVQFSLAAPIMQTDMKTLFAGIVLIVVVGLAGFFFRNVLEHSAAPAGSACTLEAKICPDGTTVGRVAPACGFATCPMPNIFLDSIGVSFAIPVGYAIDPIAPSTDPVLIASYAKMSTSSDPAAILVYRYGIPAGSTTQQILLANTLLEPSDMPPKDMSAFSPVIINARTFSEITLERFEGTVSSAYFLPRAGDVLEFEITEHGVAGWADPGLIADNLPEHRALLRMLGTLQFAGQLGSLPSTNKVR